MWEAFRQWNPVQIRSPDSVGTTDFSPGRFGDCGACAKVPDFTDLGIAAMRQWAEEVMCRAQQKLDNVLETAQGKLRDLTADAANAAVGAWAAEVEVHYSLYQIVYVLDMMTMR